MTNRENSDVSWRDSRVAVVIVCVFLVAVTWFVFGQTLRYDFVNYDDDTYVYSNPLITGGLTISGVIYAFSGRHSGNWHPLTTLSHMVDCQLWGTRPGGHHLTNIVLHTIAVVLLFLVLLQMTGALWRSAFVAVVFAIHPLRVESVAWISERKDVLSGVFFMLTLGLYRTLCQALVARSLPGGGRFVCVGAHVQANAGNSAICLIAARLLAAGTISDIRHQTSNIKHPWSCSRKDPAVCAIGGCWRSNALGA